MEEKFALITGTSSGLGLKMAEYLLTLDFTVIGVSRRGSPIEHDNFIDILCDIKDEGAVEEMYEIIKNHSEKLDIIILNAGIFEMSPLVEMSTKEFSDHLWTNVVGAFHILKHTSDFLIEDQTHIISISSVASKKGLANLSAYSASKAALNVMIESLQEEWSHLGIRFSHLLPGPIKTELWEGLDISDEQKNIMLEVEDFMNVFEMVINSSSKVHFPVIEFLNKRGSLK